MAWRISPIKIKNTHQRHKKIIVRCHYHSHTMHTNQAMSCQWYWKCKTHQFQNRYSKRGRLLHNPTSLPCHGITENRSLINMTKMKGPNINSQQLSSTFRFCNRPLVDCWLGGRPSCSWLILWSVGPYFVLVIQKNITTEHLLVGMDPCDCWWVGWCHDEE